MDFDADSRGFADETYSSLHSHVFVNIHHVRKDEESATSNSSVPVASGQGNQSDQGEPSSSRAQVPDGDQGSDNNNRQVGNKTESRTSNSAFRRPGASAHGGASCSHGGSQVASPGVYRGGEDNSNDAVDGDVVNVPNKRARKDHDRNTSLHPSLGDAEMLKLNDEADANLDETTEEITVTGKVTLKKNSSQIMKMELQSEDPSLRNLGTTQLQKGKTFLTVPEENSLTLCGKITVSLVDRICEHSKVFRGVHHGRDDEPVAVKIITKYTTENKKEIQNLKEVSEHENVVTYHGSGTCMYKGKKAIFIVMELCDMDTLAKRVSKGDRKEFHRKIHEVHQLAKGLKHIHGKRIFHRDLKPQNVLYKNGICKISDFGLSKRLPPGKSNTPQSMANIGTDGWRAPETSDCESNTTFSSDIFSLGLLFYYILSDGAHPFGPHEGSRQCYIREQNTLQKRDLKKVDDMPDPKIIKDLLESMLQYKAEDRPKVDDILAHPTFWDAEKKFGFFARIIKYLQLKPAWEEKQKKRAKESDTSASTSGQLTSATGQGVTQTSGTDGAFLKILNDRKGKYGTLAAPADWKDKLKLNYEEHSKIKHKMLSRGQDCMLSFEEIQQKSRTCKDEIDSIIRFIRNRYGHHYEDRAESGFEMTVGEFWSFFSSRYPFLFIYAYYTVKSYLLDHPEDHNFKELFEEFF